MTHGRTDHSQHTPGPWQVKNEDDDPNFFDVQGTGGDWIAEEVFGKGNARLIAAAPELLAACQSMLETCGGSQHWNGETHESLKLIEAAIAKALGK